MLRAYLFIVAFAFIGICRTTAQDIHFTQFYNAPLTLNPGETTNHDADWRAAAIYRNQWRSFGAAFNTIAASFDYQFHLKKGKIGAGIVLYNDRTRGTEGINSTKIMLSGSYQLPVKKNRFNFGLQGGLVDKRLSKATFPDQFNIETGYFDGQMATSDGGSGIKTMYFDMNAGIVWTVVGKKFTPEVGVSVYHLNFPKESFYGKSNHLKPRPVFSFSGNWQFSARWSLMPRALYMYHSGASDFIAGLQLGYSFQANALRIQKIYAGPLMREGFEAAPNAIMIAGGINFKKFELGGAFDLTSSNLNKPTNYRGAFEVSLIYKGFKNPLDIIQIPCERL
ncbi:hypothetical protein BH09BAC1_BH09BAC1_03280 [soil metagenome]